MADTIENHSTLEQRTFNRLKRLYVLALSAIALSVIISQILIRKHLNNQETDSRVVNVAGRQRMLSQKITKEILLLSTENNPEERIKMKNQLKETLNLWESSHEILQMGNDSLGLSGKNSEMVSEMFQKTAPYFGNLLEAAKSIILKVETNPSLPTNELIAAIEKAKQNEGDFLLMMNNIVNQYEVEASQKISRLRTLELLLMGFTLMVLLVELLFVFWPTAKSVKNSIHELLEAEKKAMKMAHDADVLSNAKEKSVRQLRALNQAMDQTLLFARITSDGFIVHMGDKFCKLLKIRNFTLNSKFSEVLSAYENEQSTIDHIIAENKKTGWQGEVKITTKDAKNSWLDMSLVPFNAGEDESELLVICLDITKRKEVQLEIERLTKESFEEKMQQQKVISKKIIENQENEQNRIAKDIHDGIGQMLTGLKYNLESIDLSDLEKATLKIENLKELALNIIKGLRTATFNLTPPELTDHGIVPALTKLTQELAKLTGKKILIFNKTDFNQRLDSLAEINIYRITQEAVNNAIKYAASTHIIVTLSHSKNMLSITVDDNGKGFDPEKIKNKMNGDGGMGLTFMQERIKYINGRMFMHSTPNEGTRITFNIPLY